MPLFISDQHERCDSLVGPGVQVIHRQVEPYDVSYKDAVAGSSVLGIAVVAS
jgi:hypothetical protein